MWRSNGSPAVSPAGNDTTVSLSGVRCGYGESAVLDGVSVMVPAGRFAGIVGPSGAGKTTLLRAVLGQVPHLRGDVHVQGQTVPPGSSPTGVGYVPQVESVDWSFPMTVEDVVLLGRIRRMGRLPWPNRADRRAVAATLDRLEIGHLIHRHIRDLSGGQQQRTFLARALVGEPRILLLDEPTASVDLKTRDVILRTLVDLHHGGVTILMTTHELNAVAAHLPWVICVNGGIVAEGPPRQVFTEAVLGRTFDAPMRVMPDPTTGRPLVAEAPGDWGALSLDEPVPIGTSHERRAAPASPRHAAVEAS
jgi:zinc/manganese transport system ATP-binding protein/zinc transport system ATP-binding protein